VSTRPKPKRLREDFNLHLLRSDVVRDVFSDHRQSIVTHRQVGWDLEFTGVHPGTLIPSQRNRGGAFEPRTSPYAFAGLGEEALKILVEIRERFGLKIVSEALDEPGVDLVEKYADMIQIGARNMQNYTLLRRVGRSKLPVLLKRGMAATLEEWLLAAEYIMAEGNYQVVLCERGVRTFAQHTRNTLDLAAVPAVRRISHLPIIIDASHGTGKNYMVTPLARAGVAVGADGLMIEVHCKPEEALSDGAQALTLDEFEHMANEVRAIHDMIAPVEEQRRFRAVSS